MSAFLIGFLAMFALLMYGRSVFARQERDEAMAKMEAADLSKKTFLASNSNIAFDAKSGKFLCPLCGKPMGFTDYPPRQETQFCCPCGHTQCFPRKVEVSQDEGVWSFALSDYPAPPNPEN